MGVVVGGGIENMLSGLCAQKNLCDTKSGSVTPDSRQFTCRGEPRFARREFRGTAIRIWYEYEKWMVAALRSVPLLLSWKKSRREQPKSKGSKVGPRPRITR